MATSTSEAVAALEGAVERFSVKVGKPLWVGAEVAHFRYADASPELTRILKAVRVVSALYGCRALLVRGHVAETGVLLRTIDEFLEDMTFLAREEQGGLSSLQERYVEQLFADKVPTSEELWQQREAIQQVPRKKIRAAESRTLGRIGGDPHTLAVISKNVDDVWSGFVHGSYTSTMELYKDDGFQVRGFPPRVPSYIGQLAIYIHRALNAFAHLALDLGLIDLADELVATRREFEASDDYAG